ncbi:cytochrome C biogenesis protein, partial [Clostridium sporogenes]|nr:cytochrome C biogenesis protein [Clostridium sporogenes]
TKEVLKNTITAIKKVHPYEIPVINIIPILNLFE